MRIALDSTYSVDPNPSGIAIYSRELMEGLAVAHASDRFIHCYRPKQWMWSSPDQHPNVRRALLLPPLRTFRCDVFHALNQRVDTRPARHVVCTFHDLFVLTGDYSSADFRRRFTQQAITAATNSDVIITVSEFTAGQVHDLLKVPRARVRVVPHGVHIPAGSTPIQSRENLVLFIGVLQKRKNLVRLIRAFSALPRDWKLVLAGALTGYQGDEVLDAAAQSPASERISLPGYISAEQRKDLLRRAAIFAFPSLDEGFGMPILEAMAYGVPVLTSNRSGCAEAASSAALTIDPESEEQIAGTLRRLAADASLRESLAAQGLSRAKEFSWEAACERTYSVYREPYR